MPNRANRVLQESVVCGSLSSMASEIVNITTREVAEIARVDTSTVRKWADAGTIPWAMKTPGGHYRFNRDDVLTALKKGRA